MSERNDELGAIILASIVLCVIGFYFLFTSLLDCSALLATAPLAKTAWKVLNSRIKQNNKEDRKKVGRFNKISKLILPPMIGLGLGVVTNTIAIKAAIALTPIMGPIVGGVVGAGVGVVTDFIAHCGQEFCHCAINKKWPQGKTKFKRLLKFLHGPFIGCGVSFLTNGLAIGSYNLLPNSLGTAREIYGALIGAGADVIPHTIHEMHDQHKDKESERATKTVLSITPPRGATKCRSSVKSILAMAKSGMAHAPNGEIALKETISARSFTG